MSDMWNNNIKIRIEGPLVTFANTKNSYTFREYLRKSCKEEILRMEIQQLSKYKIKILRYGSFKTID